MTLSMAVAEILVTLVGVRIGQPVILTISGTFTLKSPMTMKFVLLLIVSNSFFVVVALTKITT